MSHAVLKSWICPHNFQVPPDLVRRGAVIRVDIVASVSDCIHKKFVSRYGIPSPQRHAVSVYQSASQRLVLRGNFINQPGKDFRISRINGLIILILCPFIGLSLLLIHVAHSFSGGAGRGIQYRMSKAISNSEQLTLYRCHFPRLLM